MARLLVLVEGLTEERFVNELLEPHLTARGYQLVGARKLGLARERSRRGGIVSWPAARRDILRHLREDRNRLVTTMVDFYALPHEGENEWPGRAEAGRAAFPQKADTLNDALRADIAHGMGQNFDARRFLPYVAMHEFEGLLFSDCTRFAAGIEQPGLASDFQAIRDDFDTPEEINDSPHTAPSKRIEALVPGYEKPLLGTLAALHIGLDAIRAECPLFGNWLARLEQWPAGRQP